MAKQINFNMNKRAIKLVIVACLALGLSSVLVQAQRDNDQDDFDDAGFDDSGYNSPQNHEAEGSQHNPSNYNPSSEDDLDEDDDVDESSQIAKVASQGPQQFYSPASSIVMPLRANSIRHKRSVTNDEKDVEDLNQAETVDRFRPLIRNRRYSKSYIGPVYTYVKTDKHAHYKWGVKHKVGNHYG